MESHNLTIKIRNHRGMISKFTGFFSKKAIDIEAINMSTNSENGIKEINLKISGKNKIDNIINSLLQYHDVQSVESVKNTNIYKK